MMLNKDISAILTPNVISVEPEMRITDAISEMRKKCISCIVIVEDEKPVGLFTERDVVRAAKSGINEGLKIKDLMTTDIVKTNSRTNIYEAYGIFETNKIRHLIVEDDNCRLVGVVTLTDIINNLGLEYFVALKNVSEIMTDKVTALKRKDDTASDAISIMADRSISCIVVEEDKKPIGIITERDVTRMILDEKDYAFLKIHDVMSYPVCTISLSTPVYEAANVMKQNKIRRLVVVDENGCMSGVITQTDIVKGLRGKFTEFLKDIIREQEKLINESGRSLMESESKYRILVDNAPVGVYSSNFKGDILFANKALLDIFGFDSKEELISAGAEARYKRPEERVALIERLKKTGKVDGMEFEMLTKDGASKHIFMNAVISDGGVISGMVIDITARKQYENKLKERNEELSILNQISSVISHTIDFDELLAKVLKTITEISILNVEHKGGIFIIEADKMRLASHMGHAAHFIGLHKEIKIGECLCGRAAKTGKMIISKNSHKDSLHTVNYPGMTPHGHIIIPLKAKDMVVGVLYLYTPADIDIDDNIVRLLEIIGGQVGMAIDNARLYAEAKSLSLCDHLTGLSNRRLLNIVFDRSVAEIKRTKKPLSVIMADIDHFKSYNDTYGHLAGDKLLVEVAKLISAETRDTDVVSRYGGEEFLLLLPDTGAEEALEVAERIRQSVQTRSAVTISLGVSSCSLGTSTKEALIERADKALYKAKQSGRNRVQKEF